MKVVSNLDTSVNILYEKLRLASSLETILTPGSLTSILLVVGIG